MANIRLDQIDQILQEAKKEGKLSLDYSKIKIFSVAFKKEVGSKFQVPSYEIKKIISKISGECNIASSQLMEIENILKN